MLSNRMPVAWLRERRYDEPSILKTSRTAVRLRGNGGQSFFNALNRASVFARASSWSTTGRG
jgi:hypothetical protein